MHSPYCPTMSTRFCQPPVSQLKPSTVYPTISPQTTSCLYNPLYSCPVKKPSLPASSSRQSLDTSCSIDAASLVCASLMPNIMHFPIRARTSDSQRGDSFSVAGASVLEKRHCGGRGTGMRARCIAGTVNEVEIAGRRSAARAVRGRMLVEELHLSCRKYQRAQNKPTSKVVELKLWCSIARYLHKVKPRAAATLHTSEPRCQAPHMNTSTPQHQSCLVKTLAIA